MQTKILYIVTKGTWGGAQRYVYDLATSLPPAFSVSVIAGTEGRLMERLRTKGISTISVPHLRRDVFIFREISALVRLVRILRRERPDIVHLNSSKAGALGALAARLARVPRIIFTVHGWPFTEERSSFERALITAISWVTMMLSHKTIVLSQHDYLLANHWPGSKKVALIPNGIRHDSTYDRSHARAILTSEYGVPSATHLIGSVAELHPNKGLFDLITTLPMLPDDTHLCLIGDGELKARLEDYATQLGVLPRVSFLGFIPDAASLIPAFDAFILSSMKEGMPFVILEAGSCGVPVVATRVGGVPEIIEDGVDGYLVPIHDCEMLGARINDTLRDRGATEKRTAHLKEKIATAFSFDAVTLPRTLALYSES